MRLPEDVQAIIDEMHKKFGHLVHGEDNQRKLSRMIAEQVAFSTKDARWGVKSAGPGRPQGPSQIAFNGDNGLVAWRWLDGDGSISGIPFGVAHPPVYYDEREMGGQIFIAVAPTNHLASTPPSTSTSTTPTTSSNELILINQNRIVLTLDKLIVSQAELLAQLHVIEAMLDRRLVARIFGAKVVIAPEKPKNENSE